MPVDATRLPLAASPVRALAARRVFHALAGAATNLRGVERMRRGAWRAGGCGRWLQARGQAEGGFVGRRAGAGVPNTRTGRGADSRPPSRFDRS